MQEKKRLEEIQKKFEDLASPINNVTQSIESAIKKYPILTPIKIIVKRVDGMLEIIDLILEYQINGEKGIIIKIGGKIIENIVFNVGISIALAISTAVAGYFASMAVAGAIVGFIVFAGIAGLVIWVSNQSEELLRFTYEHIYLPTKDTFTNLKNGLDYFLSGDWFQEFIRFVLFSNTEGKRILEYELRKKYGDEAVNHMDNFDKDYRMLLGK